MNSKGISEQIYANRFDKLEEVKKKFPEKHKSPNPTQGKTNNNNNKNFE